MADVAVRAAASAVKAAITEDIARAVRVMPPGRACAVRRASLVDPVPRSVVERFAIEELCDAIPARPLPIRVILFRPIFLAWRAPVVKRGPPTKLSEQPFAFVRRFIGHGEQGRLIDPAARRLIPPRTAGPRMRDRQFARLDEFLEVVVHLRRGPPDQLCDASCGRPPAGIPLRPG